MLKTFWAIFCLWMCGLACAAQAGNYPLVDGTTLAGEPVTYGDTGIIFRLPDDKYTERMPWTKFSQAALGQLAEDSKIKPFVEPFLAPPPVERTQAGDEIKVQPVTRLDLPAHQFILGAMFSSSVGLFLLFVVYAANFYAAYEVASCRARPVGMVMGLSAVLPVVGPAIFFLMPTNMPPIETTPAVTAAPDAVGSVASAAAASAAADAAVAALPEGADPAVVAAAVAAAAQASRARAAAAAAAGVPDPHLDDIQVTPVTPAKEATVSQSFKRGQFTFNRRFFETKFPGFLLPVRSEADQKLEFTVRATQGSYVVEHIARIGTNDVVLDVLQDQQRQEVLVAFGDIQEITIKTKTA